MAWQKPPSHPKSACNPPIPASILTGRVKPAENAVFLGARWGEVGWRGGRTEGHGFCRAAGGAGGEGPDDGGLGEAGFGGVANGLRVTVTLHEGFWCYFWDSRLQAGVGKGLGLVGFACGSPAQDRMAAGNMDWGSEPGQDKKKKKRKLAPKYWVLCVWGCVIQHVCALVCLTPTQPRQRY